MADLSFFLPIFLYLSLLLGDTFVFSPLNSDVNIFTIFYLFSIVIGLSLTYLSSLSFLGFIYTSPIRVRFDLHHICPSLSPRQPFQSIYTDYAYLPLPNQLKILSTSSLFLQSSHSLWALISLLAYFHKSLSLHPFPIHLHCLFLHPNNLITLIPGYLFNNCD